MNTKLLQNIAISRYACKAYNPNKVIDAPTFDTILDALVLAPSSINIQPWEFLVADNHQSKTLIADSMAGANQYNIDKVMNASHTIVLCTKTNVDSAHLNAVLQAEYDANRFANQEQYQARVQLCQNYLSQYRTDMDYFTQWCEQQTFIALGHLLMAAQVVGVQTTAIGGFDAKILSDKLNLSEKQLKPSIVVCLGYADDNDPNKALAKARLPKSQVITYL